MPGSRLPGEIVNNCAMSRVEGLKNGEFSPCGCEARERLTIKTSGSDV